MHPALMLKLSEALKNNDSQEYSDILDRHQFSQDSFVSDCNLTIFHDIANSKINEKYLIPFLEKTAQAIQSKLSHQSLLQLINSQVQIEDKFSALHLSILRGKAVIKTQNLAKRLIELGADPSQKTGKGRNGLHLCAEAGLLSLFLFIRDEYGLALDLQDHKGLCPIHLAISERREDMAMLILSLCKGLDINVKLALEMAVQTGSYKITRNLLIHRRQESLDVRNLAKSEDKDIGKLLEHPKAGQRNCFYFCLMIFGFLTKYSSIAYFILFIGEGNLVTQSVNAARLLTLLIIVVLALVINQVNPGFEVYNEKVSLMELYSKYIPEYVCPYCELKKHKATKHCYSCQKCVRDFDHHCKWLNNCIGRSNLNLFIALLIFCIINVFTDIVFYCLACFEFHDINWTLLLNVPGLEFLHQYLEVYTIVVDLAVILIAVPVTYKLAKRRRKVKKVSKKLPREPLLSNPDHLKGFRDLENEATSDTTSMFLKNTLDSNSESASSSTFLSQFFSNRSQ